MHDKLLSLLEEVAAAIGFGALIALALMCLRLA